MIYFHDFLDSRMRSSVDFFRRLLFFRQISNNFRNIYWFYQYETCLQDIQTVIHIPIFTLYISLNLHTFYLTVGQFLQAYLLSVCEKKERKISTARQNEYLKFIDA